MQVVNVNNLHLQLFLFFFIHPQSIIVKLYCNITSISCINVAQMMVATDKLSILRINWAGNEERDYSLDLRRIPFSINQQVRCGKVCIIAIIMMIHMSHFYCSRPDCWTRCLCCVYGLLATLSWLFYCSEGWSCCIFNIQ